MNGVLLRFVADDDCVATTFSGYICTTIDAVNIIKRNCKITIIKLDVDISINQSWIRDERTVY
jgi:hypothetical protein